MGISTEFILNPMSLGNKDISIENRWKKAISTSFDPINLFNAPGTVQAGMDADLETKANEDMAAKDASLIQEANEAEALAEKEAKDAARKKLAQQTQTIFSTTFGNTSQTKKTTLGSGS